MTLDKFQVGARVKLTQDVERYPFFIAPAGRTGTVVVNESGMLYVRLDDPLDGAAEWGNEVRWDLQANPTDDPYEYLVEVLPWEEEKPQPTTTCRFCPARVMLQIKKAITRINDVLGEEKA